MIILTVMITIMIITMILLTVKINSQVNAGTHAFLEGTEYFRYMVILHKATNTYFLQEPLFPSYVGWIYPKQTPWKHKFDQYIQRFVEAGLCFYYREVCVRER